MTTDNSGEDRVFHGLLQGNSLSLTESEWKQEIELKWKPAEKSCLLAYIPGLAQLLSYESRNITTHREDWTFLYQ